MVSSTRLDTCQRHSTWLHSDLHLAGSMKQTSLYNAEWSNSETTGTTQNLLIPRQNGHKAFILYPKTNYIRQFLRPPLLQAICRHCCAWEQWPSASFTVEPKFLSILTPICRWCCTAAHLPTYPLLCYSLSTYRMVCWNQLRRELPAHWTHPAIIQGRTPYTLQYSARP